MTECPYCQTSSESTDLFCRSCGASRILPEYDRAFCPHCGIRVSTRQQLCHECKWPLNHEGEENNSPYETRPVSPASKRKFWMIGVVLGTGLIALVGAWLFFLRTTPPQPSGAEAPSAIVREKDQEKPAKSPSQSIITLPSPSPLPQVPEPDKSEPPSHDEALAKQLATVLQNLQEAQMKKDIFQYMKSYSNSFPELEQKREKTLKIWRLYDYGNLKFELGEVKSLDTDNAVAQVKWNIESHSQQTQKIETSMQTYTVWFIKDPEGWRIKRVEQLTSN